MDSIKNIFTKIFDQYIIDINNFYITPLNINIDKYFKNNNICQIINNITKCKVSYIKKILYDTEFQKSIISMKIDNVLYTKILFGDHEFVKNNINKIKFDKTCLKIAIVNSYQDIIETILSKCQDFINTKILKYSVFDNSGNTYQYLCNKYNIVPNIYIIYCSTQYDNDNIFNDIRKIIEPNSETLKIALENNSVKILNILLDNYNLEIEPEWITYPILNAELELTKKIISKYSINLIPDIYYSALLSGSMDMIKYIESVFINIHNNYYLDSQCDKKNIKTDFIKEMCYTKNNKIYFSHVMNYAIQSNKINIVKYIIDIGYGTSLSNIITAIQQADTEILKLLLTVYNHSLPLYVVHNVGINCYINDKIEKLILISNYIEINYKFSVELKQIEKVL